jgi:hypothetical protein
MRNYTIELTEPQIKMLASMYRDFDFGDFIENNPKIEDEESVGWYSDELDNLFNDICNWDEEIDKK